MTACKMKDIHMLDVKKTEYERKRVLVCIAMIEMYCGKDKNVL